MLQMVFCFLAEVLLNFFFQRIGLAIYSDSVEKQYLVVPVFPDG